MEMSSFSLAGSWMGRMGDEKIRGTSALEMSKLMRCFGDEAREGWDTFRGGTVNTSVEGRGWRLERNRQKTISQFFLLSFQNAQSKDGTPLKAGSAAVNT